MINDHLIFSEEALTMLQSLEGYKLYPYDDTTGKPIREWNIHATIGYGYLISEKEWRNFKHGISQKIATDLLTKIIPHFEEVVRKYIIVPLAQNQFDALVIFVYNIGPNAFKKSSVVKMVNDRRAATKYPTLELAWKAWNKQNHSVIPGLVNRRRIEWDLYANGQYLVA